MKKYFLVIMLIGFLMVPSFAEDKTITGKVESISLEDSSIMIASKKIFVQKDYIDESLIMVGDDLKVVYQEIDGVLKAVDLEYLSE